MPGFSGGSGDPLAQWSDEAIVSRVQVCTKDNHKREAQEAFEQLYIRHMDRILHLILFLLNSSQASSVAEDLAEDTFMNAYDALVIRQATLSFNEPGKVQAWLNKIAYNEVRKHWRKVKHDAFLDPPEDGRGKSLLEEVADKEAPSFTESVEQRIAIEEAKSKLLPRDRRIIELAFEEDMDIKQVAKILGINVNNARQARLRAAERFAEHFRGPLSSIQGQQNDSPGGSSKSRSARKKVGRSDE